jgi:outer membrane protein assembly factor BamB
MQYYNGVIYFNGGGNGLLHALNAQTGEYIWQYSSPDLKHNSGAWFDSAISIDKATGRIYTSNYLNALCFEAM